MPQVGAHSPPEPVDPTQAPNFYADDTPAPADVDPVDEPAIIIGDDPAPAVDTQALETEARDMGWVPLAEWRGPKAAWVDAARFVDRGRTVLPIVNAQLARERVRAQELEREVADLRREANENRQHRTEQTDARAAVEETALRAQRRQALEESDFDRVNAIDDKLLDLRVEKKIKAAVPKPAPAVDTEGMRVMQEFTADNKWMNTDKELVTALALEMKSMRQVGVETRGRQFVDEAAERVKRMYPEKFPRARRAAIADTGGSSGASSGGRSYAQLKPEYRAQCDKMVKAGELKNNQQFVAECDNDAFVGY